MNNIAYIRNHIAPADEIETMPLAAAIGLVVYTLRKQKRMTQANLAERAQLSAGGISRIERGGSCRLASLTGLAGALGCKVSDLILAAELTQKSTKAAETQERRRRLA